MANRIHQITIISGDGVGITEVGTLGIAEIKDCSREYPDHTEFVFEAYTADGQLVKRIINCPVEIKYLGVPRCQT